MLARIIPVKSLINTLYYSEHKQEEGKAQLLLAENFIKRKDQLDHQDILDRFHQRTSLNERPEKKIFHIFITFDISEKLSDEKMTTLARRYMEGMAFDRQPWLLYRHDDAAHPHLHVISTNIRRDGSRIDIKIGDLRRSLQLTNRLEDEFSLVKNIRPRQERQEQYEVTAAQRVIYGQSGVKHAISDVLNTVVNHYNYKSIDELNAILHLYNVRADRGAETSRLYQNHGLVYQVLDENGKAIGKSINAGTFLCRPTLPNLEKRIEMNNKAQLPQQRERVTSAIEWSFAGTDQDWPGFKEAMEREGISVVLQKGDKEGGPCVFFIDHREKSVFSGPDLDHKYSLRAIRDRCVPEKDQVAEETLQQLLRLQLGL